MISTSAVRPGRNSGDWSSILTRTSYRLAVSIYPVELGRVATFVTLPVNWLPCTSIRARMPGRIFSTRDSCTPTSARMVLKSGNCRIVWASLTLAPILMPPSRSQRGVGG